MGRTVSELHDLADQLLLRLAQAGALDIASAIVLPADRASLEALALLSRYGAVAGTFAIRSAHGGGDKRRRYWRLTAHGRQAARRIARLVPLAHARPLVHERTAA